MGMRGNIRIEYKDGSPIYFYSHWYGNNLAEILRQALLRGKPRWNDESYLARIIFSEMIKNEVLEETGYGIAPYIMDNEYQIVCVNMKDLTVKIGDRKPVSFAEYVEELKPIADE